MHTLIKIKDIKGQKEKNESNKLEITKKKKQKWWRGENMSDSASGVHVLLINEMSDRQKWAKEGEKKKRF